MQWAIALYLIGGVVVGEIFWLGVTKGDMQAPRWRLLSAYISILAFWPVFLYFALKKWS